jgi:hypothetical protein
MNLRAEILKDERSRSQTEHIARWIGSDPKRFARLMDLFLNDEYRVVQRAAWVVSAVADQYPERIEPWLKPMISKLITPEVPVAVKRNVVRVLRHRKIPKSLHGVLMNACLGFVADPKETVAVRCFSMTILAELAEIYPEIRQELETIIRDQLEQGATPGFRSLARKVLAGRGTK